MPRKPPEFLEEGCPACTYHFLYKGTADGSGSGAGAIIAIAAVAIGATVAAGLLANRKVPCPRCKNPIRRGIAQCPYCYSSITWS
jgi:hypothetical protein